MRIIALRGCNSCGKTSTLNLVYNNVLNNGGKSTNKRQVGGDRNDFSDFVNYKGLKIAFYTMGDYSIHTINAIKYYDTFGVDVLICASNIKFKKPIVLISSYEHNLVVKTIASPNSLANNLMANTTDANKILGLI